MIKLSSVFRKVRQKPKLSGIELCAYMRSPLNKLIDKFHRNKLHMFEKSEVSVEELYRHCKIDIPHSAISDEQFKRLSAELETSHQGARKAGRPMLLEGGLDWKPMGFSPADMEFLKTREAAAREIALAFGAPPQLLGLPGDNTYANYQEANRAFYRQTVLPLSRRVAAALTGWLGWRWAGDLALTPDLEAVTALQSERESQWRRIASADFLDPDEKRAMLGLPPRGGA